MGGCCSSGGPQPVRSGRVSLLRLLLLLSCSPRPPSLSLIHGSPRRARPFGAVADDALSLTASRALSKQFYVVWPSRAPVSPVALGRTMQPSLPSLASPGALAATPLPARARSVGPLLRLRLAAACCHLEGLFSSSAWPMTRFRLLAALVGASVRHQPLRLAGSPRPTTEPGTTSSPDRSSPRPDQAVHDVARALWRFRAVTAVQLLVCIADAADARPQPRRTRL